MQRVGSGKQVSILDKSLSRGKAEVCISSEGVFLPGYRCAGSARCRFPSSSSL